IRFHSGISLAASFADETAKFTKSKVGLIPCADGGTKISQWQPGEILFDHAIMMTKLAMRTSNLGGIIWHQGESDCRNFDADKYRKDFLTMVTQLRKAINAENLPFIMGEISESIAADGWNVKDNPSKMNRLLHTLKDEIPCCEIALATGLDLKDDGHLFL
ncbi:MAG: sialate O-acetylesterase, partial [Clostridia bacterium]|nr:sialate O-acetylesterase [Clostridia bacterium]